MAITFIGAAQNSAINGGNITLSLSGIAGIASGDFVYAASGTFGRAGNEGRIGNALSFNQDLDTTPSTRRLRTAWKRYVSGTDGTLTIEGSANNADCTTGVALVFRGATPLRLATTSLTANNAAAVNPDPPAITPPENDCAVIVGATSSVQDTTPGTITNYTEPTNFNSNNTDTNPQTTCMAYRLLSGGKNVSEDPAAFSSWTSSAWVSFSVVLMETRIFLDLHQPFQLKQQFRAIGGSPT